MTPIQRRPCGPDLIDSEDTEDGRLISAQMPTVGLPEIAIKYGSSAQPWRTLDHGEVPRGFSRKIICGFETYTNDQAPRGYSWHSDVSKLVIQATRPNMTEGPRAGMALTCGPLQVIARVHAPQTSYRAELMGLCVAASLAQPGSCITLDKTAVVDHGPSVPTF